MKIKLITLIGLAACLLACSKSQDVNVSVPDPSRPVQFTVSNLYQLETKADAIANGKYVAVYAGDPIKTDNVKMTVSMEANATSGTLAPTAANSLLWAVGQTTAATKFFAVYPWEETRPLVKPGETPEGRAVEANWYIEYSIANTESSVDYADKFLTAAASQAPGAGAEPAKVALAFKHPFAKLVYNITNTSDDYVAGLKVSGIRQTGNVMFATGAVTTTGTAIASDAAVSLVPNGENSWMTVVMPEAEAVNPTITVEMGSGARYVYTLAAAVALEAGKVYTAAVAVSGNHNPSTSDRTVYGTFTVTDWVNVNAGDMSAGGSTAAAKWWYLVGNVDVIDGTTNTDWSKCIPFKCVGPDTWQVDFYYAGTADDGSTGFKFMHADPESVPAWDDVWGMGTGTNLWTIGSATVFAQDDTVNDAHYVHDMASPGNDMKMSIADQDSRKYRIVFTPATRDYYIYKITD